ncbi:MAG: Hsp20/alpha crystallin family protein [Bryobacteraceae bacterium]|nr:Hsp20/alpha crystallin family protein [Bryobacteraceae bacterium]
MTVFLFSAPRQVAEWSPAVDIYRTVNGWILKFDLAGVRLEDVHVHFGKRCVKLSGVRRDSMLEDFCTHYSMEITYSRFERTVDLPEDLDAVKSRLEYQDGILLVRITRREEKTNE